MSAVLITGLGAVSPAGLGADALWHAVSAGAAIGGAVTDWDVSGNRSRIGSRVPPEIRAALPVRSGRDLFVRYAEAAAEEAWCDAGLADADVDLDRVGVCIGTAVGGVATMERAYASSASASPGGPRACAAIDPRTLPAETYADFRASAAGEAVARALGLRGFFLSPSTGCTAGLDAIGLAADSIAVGRADVMVCGASEAPFSPIVLTSFDNIHCLSSRNDRPEAASRPFDRDRDGFLLGEGAGIIILESEAHALRRGARVRGRFLGYASGSSAYHMTALANDGGHQAAVISAALARARVQPKQISYFNLHGTSTPQNDISETAAIKSALGAPAYDVPMSSTKSVIGHALGAASALASVVGLRAIGAALVPPTANLDCPGEGCDLDYVAQGPRRHAVSLFGINASGFSGIHTTAFFAEA